jgi:TrmH family RNA methyltransferase
VKRLKALQQRNGRKKTGEFLLEGGKMIGEALRSGQHLTTLLYTEESALEPEWKQQLEAQGTAVYAVAPHVLEAVTDTRTPQPVAASCVMALRERPLEECSTCLLLDGLQDPGNMGTILRTAEAMGMDLVIAAGCVELFNPKVVRSTMGSLFRQPVLCVEEPCAILERMRREGFTIWASLLDDQAQSVAHTTLGGKVCVMVGNEAHGVSPQAAALSHGGLYIDMMGQVESLNAGVAAGILMWEMARAHKQKR